MLRTGVAAACAILAIGSGCSHKKESTSKVQAGAAVHPEPVKPKENPKLLADETGSYTELSAHHVVFHEGSGILLRSEWLRAHLYATREGVIPSLDDPASFRVEIYDGMMEISARSISAALNSRLFKGSKLSKIRVSARGKDGVEINAILHKGVPLPIRLTGQIGTTPDGRLRVQLTGWQVLRIPFKGIMKAIRLDASDLIHFPQSEGIQVNGDTVYIRPEDLLPPPAKTGLVTAVQFAPNGDLVEQFGRGRSDLPVAGKWPNGKWHNFVHLKGGTIRFDRLTMTNTDLVLIDTSPGDWYDFDLAHYREQIVHGSMYMTANGGLRVLTPDITKIAGR